MKRKNWGLVFAVVLGGAAIAGETAVYESLDADGNGYLSRSEAAGNDAVYEAFDSADANADGQLNIDEFMAFESEGRFVPPEENEVPELGAAPTQ